jgi:hypothetical protein
MRFFAVLPFAAAAAAAAVAPTPTAPLAARVDSAFRRARRARLVLTDVQSAASLAPPRPT